MFISSKRIDHDTWMIEHNVYDAHRTTRRYVHSYQNLAAYIISLTASFEYASTTWRRSQPNNLYVSFDNAEDFDESVWRIADYLKPCLFRTNHFAASYKL